ncbi:MAG: glucosaminidase domain-containing protein [Bacteroidales bacterium]|nr:glucosaminidase domain-containing protein [Bacteroidales bacterium]MBN2819995.1 glucosaminidase domain-containing protein [Bacteroidales bacterium]
MRYSCLIAIILTHVFTFGQKQTRAEYIEMYRQIAMDEMVRTGIPASITLAQGIIESGDGNSRLATKANNHFGIKCHDWEGPKIKHDDDAKNECFRKYKSVEESYQDHSDFLTTKSRYSSLFELKPDDYKGWAKGLKQAGYATSPTYAKALISVIEENELYIYDQQILAERKDKKTESGSRISDVEIGENRKIAYNNRVKYILADSNDSYEKLAEELHMFSWQLPKYNEQASNTRLNAGDIVYLQPKRNRTYGKEKTYVVREGETLNSISQEFAVKESKLRERNNIPEEAEPEVGAELLLRGKGKGTKVVTVYKPKEKRPEEKENDTEAPVQDDEFIIEFEL